MSTEVLGSIGCSNSSVTSFADHEQRATNIYDLYHPYVLLYLLHCVAALIGFFLSLYAPGCYALVMVLSGLTFLISACTGWPIWGYEPGSFIWIGVVIKWLIVNILATIPVLLLRAKKMPPSVVRMVAFFVYFILGSNILWTLGMESKGHIIVYLNRVAGVMLVIALILHSVAVCRAGLGLFEVRKGFVYGFGTSLPWLICYTVWNALFIAKITVGGVLQDILFWCLMAGYKQWDDYHLPIELYFAFARPVQLGTYIGFTEFVGAFIPYFYQAPELTECHPLPINSHAFFLFIAFMNMLFSFLCVFNAGQRLVCGLGYFQERFEAVHGIGQERSLMESKFEEESSEEDGYDDSDDEEEEGSSGGCTVS